MIYDIMIYVITLLAPARIKVNPSQQKASQICTMYSTCDREVVDSSPTRGELFSVK